MSNPSDTIDLTQLSGAADILTFDPETHAANDAAVYGSPPPSQALSRGLPYSRAPSSKRVPSPGPLQLPSSSVIYSHPSNQTHRRRHTPHWKPEENEILIRAIHQHSPAAAVDKAEGRARWKRVRETHNRVCVLRCYSERSMESLKQQWRKLIKEHTGDEAVQCRASGTIHISSELADMIANQVHLLNDIRRSRSSRQTPQHLQRHQAVAVAREFQQISSLNAMHTLSQRRAMASSEQGDSFETSTDNSPQPTRRQQVQQDTSVIDALSNHFERHAAQQEQLTEARNAYLERKISMMHETAELQKAESQARIEYLKAKTETIQTNYDSIEALKRSYEVTAKAYEDRFNRLETMLGSMMSQFSLLTQSGALSSDSLDPGTPRSRRRHTPSPSTTPTRRSQRSVRPRR